jgi:hypothetical protein
VLEHCSERETSCWLSIFGALPSDRIPKATNDVKVHLFIHSSKSCKFDLRIPVSYTSEFREFTEASKYVIPGTAVAQCLGYCATNRKVAGSIPDGVIGIFH